MDGTHALAARDDRGGADRRRARAAAARLPGRRSPTFGVEHDRSSAAAPHHRGPALEHGASRPRLHGAVRGDRCGGSMAGGAHPAARTAHVGGPAGAPARHPRLRRRLRLDLPRSLSARVPRRRADHDAVALPAGLPARAGRIRERRSGPRGGRAQPRDGTLACLLEGYPAPDLTGGARRLPARHTRAARRVRSVRDRPVPDLHRGHLHRVPARLRHGHRLRAVARAGGIGHRRARRRAPSPAAARRRRSGPALLASPSVYPWGASRSLRWQRSAR